MTDEFDTDLARSLQQRAAAAPTDGCHFGDVRRRVRRRRQRHVAMGVLPALAGVAYLGSRPVAEPTQTAGAPDTTWMGDPTSTTMAMSTTTWPGDEVGYRCLAESGYDLGDGWVYYSVCEAGPAMTVPYDPAVQTTLGYYEPTTTVLFGTTTSEPEPSLPVNVPTTAVGTTSTSTTVP
ncbi:MAG: hypothetical protein Q8M22_17760 [Actinomycetota bacterium]|nr:hypothetical protein [Actinomycetota bacterium]